MRRHVMSAMYNNFIFMYINLFQKRISCKRTCKENKIFMPRVIKLKIKLSMDGKDKLEKFSKKFQKQENIT